MWTWNQPVLYYYAIMVMFLVKETIGAFDGVRTHD